MLATPLLILLMTQAPQPQKPPAAGQAPAKRATVKDEEKEMLKNRELLESLELLRSFEQIRYFELFTQGGKNPTKGTPAAKTPAKDNADKSIRQ
jgi:hypothetical protein